MLSDDEQRRLVDRVDKLQSRVSFYDNLLWVIGILAAIFGLGGGFAWQVISKADDDISRLKAEIAKIGDLTSNLKQAKSELDGYKANLTQSLGGEEQSLEQKLADSLKSKSLSLGDVVCNSLAVGAKQSVRIDERASCGYITWYDSTPAACGQMGVDNDNHGPFMRLMANDRNLITISQNKEGGVFDAFDRMSGTSTVEISFRDQNPLFGLWSKGQQIVGLGLLPAGGYVTAYGISTVTPRASSLGVNEIGPFLSLVQDGKNLAELFEDKDGGLLHLFDRSGQQVTYAGVSNGQPWSNLAKP